QARTDFAGQSDATGYPLLARPIFALPGGGESVRISSFPGLATGGINVTSASRLWGFEQNVAAHSDPLISEGADNHISLDLFAGFRYTDLSEDLQVFSTTTPINALFP